MDNIMLLVGFFVAGLLFVALKNLIGKGFLRIVKGKITKTKVKGKEIFNWKKVRKGMLSFFDPIEWSKSIKEIIDIRKLTVYMTILGVIFAYGWYQGKQDTAVQIELGYGKEAYIQIEKNTKLHIARDGYVYLENNKGKKLRQISVKDMPGLRKKLSPIGLQLEPIAIVGYGVGGGYYYDNSGVEAGAGVSFLRYWQGRMDVFLTNRGIYGGVSYKLDKLKMKNSSLGFAVGRGWRGDTRGIVYWSVKF